MESIEHEEWWSVKNIKIEKEKATAAARNIFKKDYLQIQIKAIEEWIPYQTLISSIVHKYLNDSLAPRS